MVSKLTKSICNARHPGLIREVGRSAGEGNGNPFPVFLPGEFHGQTMASYIIHGVTKSWTQLSDTQKYLKVKKKDCLL